MSMKIYNKKSSSDNQSQEIIATDGQIDNLIDAPIVATDGKFEDLIIKPNIKAKNSKRKGKLEKVLSFLDVILDTIIITLDIFNIF